MTQPTITWTTHTLPFDKLAPRDFERLCSWLVEREEPALSLSKGYERAEHLGAAGSERAADSEGRDVVAWREGTLWAFQCKRVRSFGPQDALAYKLYRLTEEIGVVEGRNHRAWPWYPG